MSQPHTSSIPRRRKGVFPRLSALFILMAVIAISAAVVPSASAQTTDCASILPISLSGAYTQNFDTLATSGITNTLFPPGWCLIETGGGARDNEQYAAGDGSSNTGDTYSFGTGAATDRAIGGLQSGTLIPLFGAAFVNNTGSTVAELAINYRGEVWRYGTVSREDRLDFQYSTNATSLNNGTWTDFNSLDYSETSGGTTGAVNGNSAFQNISSTITGLNIANGTTFWIRWSDFNAGGADDGAAIDDVSITPGGGAVNQPVAATCPVSASFTTGTGGSVNVSATDPDGTVTGALITSGAAAGITLDSIVPAGSPGGNLTAVLNVAGSVGTGNYNLQLTFSNNDASPQTATCNIAVSVTPLLTIPEVQGAGHASSYDGSTVTVLGVVTGYYNSTGFFLQDEAGDGNIATSDAIFVYTNATNALSVVNVGDRVQVTGTVDEFGFSGGLNVTELVNPSIVKVSTGNPLPGAVEIGNSGTCGTSTRIPPTEVIEDDGFTSFDPAADGIDFYESLEAMRVCVVNGRVVGPTALFGSTREIWVVPNNGSWATSSNARGGVTVQPTDYNPERVQFDNHALLALGLTDLPLVSVGTTFPGAAYGMMHYSFNVFEMVLSAAAPAADTSSTVTREVTPYVGGGSGYTIATYNVENLDPGDATFAAHADRIVNNLHSPDILLIQEAQDNNGETNNSTVDATTTFSMLITAIQAAGGPTYSYVQINPVDDADGGAPGGNIRVGTLYRTDRGITLASGAAGGSTDSTSVVCTSGVPSMNYAYGRIDPTNPAFSASRKPLVAQFFVNGRAFFIINNHWNSKGGDNGLFGSVQPPILSSETQRIQQAQIVRSFVDSLYACDPNVNVVVAGDLNDFWYSNPVNLLEGSSPTRMYTASEVLVGTASERYGYVFEGNSQTLDQIVFSEHISAAFSPAYDAVHINAEFADQTSDHDPSVLYITVPAASADLSLSKTVSTSGGAPVVVGSPAPQLAPGDTVTYTINIYNEGPDAATNVTVVDNVPNGLTITNVTPAPECAFAGQTVTCTFASVAVGGVGVPVYTITITTTAGAEGIIAANTAQVTASGTADPDSTPNDGTGDDFATANGLTIGEADLQVTMTSAGGTDYGTAHTYTVNLFNLGPIAAPNVTVVSNIPAGMSITGVTPAGCGFVGQVVTCTFANVAVGDSVTPIYAIDIAATINATGTIGDANAQVTASGVEDPDSTPNDNTGDDYATAAGLTVAAAADLSLTKTGAATANFGDTFDYVITLTNAGPDAAATVTVFDSVPVGLTITNVTPAECTPAGQDVTCNFAAVTVGTPIIVTITVQVTSAGDIAANAAQVTASATFDPDSTPNDGVGDDYAEIAGFTVGNPANLSIAKVFVPDAIVVGEPSVLTITITNPLGNPALTGLAFTDDLPLGLEFTAAAVVSTCGGTAEKTDADTLTLTGGTLAAGASSCTVEVTVIANGAADGELVNLTSVVTADGGISSAAGAEATITVGEVEPEPPTSIPGPTATIVPAQTFLCDNLLARSNGALTGSGGRGNILLNNVRGDTYCRIIVADGRVITYLAEVGNATLINLNIVQAVDVFGLLPSGAPVVPFVTPVNICMRGAGTVYFLSANDRSTPAALASTPGSTGYVCVTVPNAGTLVLTGQALPSAPPPPAAAEPLTEIPLSGCQVTTLYLARLRSTPDTSSSANVIDNVPYDLTLTATAYVPGWYRVIYGANQGYISEELLSTSGTCPN